MYGEQAALSTDTVKHEWRGISPLYGVIERANRLNVHLVQVTGVLNRVYDSIVIAVTLKSKKSGD